MVAVVATRGFARGGGFFGAVLVGVSCVCCIGSGFLISGAVVLHWPKCFFLSDGRSTYFLPCQKSRVFCSGLRLVVNAGSPDPPPNPPASLMLPVVAHSALGPWGGDDGAKQVP